MLNSNKSCPRDDTSQGFGSLSAAEPFSSVTRVFRHQMPVVVVSMSLVMVLGFLYLFTTQPTYLASATVVIDARKAESFENGQPVRGDNAIDAGAVQTQIQILKSASIARRVVQKLQLSDDPEFIDPRGGLTDALTKLISWLLPAAEPEDLTKRAVATLEGKCIITRVGQSYVIEIGVESLNPNKAARIANAMAEAYLDDQLETGYAAARRASDWLQQRANELRTQASATQRAVVEFKSKNNIVTAGQGRLMNDQQLTEINTQLVLAQAATAEAKARYERTREILKQELPDARVTEALKSEVIIKLREQYLDLASREALFAERYGPNHLATENLKSQMREILRSIRDEMQKIEEGAKSDYEIARTRERSVRESLGQAVSQSQMTDQAQIQLNELESAAQTAKQLYDNFLERYMQAIQQQSFPITEARLVDPAEPPTSKNHPKKFLILLLTGAVGFVVSFGAASLREFSDQVFRSSEQVQEALLVKCLAVLPDLQSNESSSVPVQQDARAWPAAPAVLRSAQLGLSYVLSRFIESLRPLLVKCLTVLPKPQTAGSSSAPAPQDTMALPTAPAALRRAKPLFSYVLDEPFSQFTEGLRSVKVANDLRRSAESLKVVGFTSTLPHEGKSTIAANYAHVIAQGGRSAVLIDADLRNPDLSRHLAPPEGFGLADVITGGKTIDDAMVSDQRSGLMFLPSGSTSILTMLNTNDLLCSAAMKKLIGQLRQRYDSIIIDFPPLIPIVDARATANFVDGYIYVVEWGRTRIDAAKYGLSNAPELHEKLLGALLNRAEITRIRRYDHSAQYYSKYSAQYSQRF
jgi:polysaccharide biosynthesis transport protein